MNVIKISALGLAGLLATTVHADPKLTVSGNLAEYYQVSLNDTVTSPSGNVSYRSFDQKQNEFAIEGGEVNFASIDEATKTSAFVNILVGPKADLINANNGLASSNFMVGQAFVTKTWGDAKVSFGKFPTFVGTEVEAVPSNMNFSRGAVYGLEPVYNVGLKVDYSLPASFTLTGQLDNGNSVDNAISEGKGYGIALAYAGIKNLGLTASWTGSPKSKNAAGIKYQDFANLLVSFQAMETLGFNLEYLYTTTIDSNPNTDPTKGAIANSPKNHGIAAYVNWATPMKGLSLIGRYENIINPDATNVGTDPYAMDTYTLTAKYVDGPLTHFVEFRTDASDLYQFSKSGSTDKLQTNMTLTYAAAYSF